MIYSTGGLIFVYFALLLSLLNSPKVENRVLLLQALVQAQERARAEDVKRKRELEEAERRAEQLRIQEEKAKEEMEKIREAKRREMERKKKEEEERVCRICSASLVFLPYSRSFQTLSRTFTTGRDDTKQHHLFCTYKWFYSAECKECEYILFIFFHLHQENTFLRHMGEKILL